MLTLLVLGLIGLGWLLLSPWVRLPTQDRLAQLSQVSAIESAAVHVPPSWLEQLEWLVRHRLARLFSWRTYLVSALLVGAVEGYFWRRQQYFRGYHRMLWLSSGLLLTGLVGAVVLFLLMPDVVPAAWTIASGFVLCSMLAFCTVSGFHAVK